MVCNNGKELKKALYRSMVEITILAILLAISANATPVEEWNKTFGGTGDDYGYAVQQISDGGFILAGSTESYGAGYTDAWLIKADANGNELWKKTFGGTSYGHSGKGDDYAYDVQLTSDGGYILAGRTTSFINKGQGWLIKTDANGNEQWNRTFGGNEGSDQFESVQQTSDSGYILAGKRNSLDVWLLRTDANGNELWNKTLEGGEGKMTGSLFVIRQVTCYDTPKCVSSEDHAYSVHQTSDGGYILAGYTMPYYQLATNKWGISAPVGWIIKTDANGNVQWDTKFEQSVYKIARSIYPITEGGYIIAGEGATGYSGTNDAWLMKTDANGKKQWSKTFGGVNDDGFKSVQQTSDGGYILAGYKGSIYSWGNESKGEAWFMKTDANGSIQWDRIFNGSLREQAASVKVTSDGGYIITGFTNSYGAGDYDAWLLKLSSGLVDSYLPPGATPEERKAGLIRAMDDYFDNGALTKPELLSVLDAYFA
jgi:hypothetical protein